jgi:hypothetical protein
MEERLKIILLAAAVRLALAPFFMHAADLGTLYESSAMVLRGQNVYDYVYGRTLQLQGATGLPVFFEGYAYHPLLVYFFVPFYWFFTLIAGSNPVMISTPNASVPTLIYPWILLLILMLKVPIILADLVVVFLLARFDLGKARIYAFCPYVIFVSAISGMTDGLVAAFLLASYLTWKRNSFLSGILYGLSVLKIYTIILLPLYLVRLAGKPRVLAKFLVGFALTILPVGYYFIMSPDSIWNVLVNFQATRVMGGVNLYNFIWIISDLHFDIWISTIPNILLLAAVLVLVLTFGRKAPFLQSTLAIMLSFFLFGKVINEQFLVSIFLLILLCRECDGRLWVLPFAFSFLRTPPFAFYYFAIPIFSANSTLYSYYLQVDVAWKEFAATGCLQIVMYALGVAFSLAILSNLLRILKGDSVSVGPKWTASIPRHGFSLINGLSWSWEHLRAGFGFFADSPRRSMTWQREEPPTWLQRQR